MTYARSLQILRDGKTPIYGITAFPEAINGLHRHRNHVAFSSNSQCALKIVSHSFDRLSIAQLVNLCMMNNWRLPNISKFQGSHLVDDIKNAHHTDTLVQFFLNI